MPMTTSQLKQFALAVHNFAYGTEWDDEDIVSSMDFDVIIEKMKTDEKELVKLKKENEGLQKEHDRMSAYMYPREIKYCEKCMKYGDEDEIVQDEEDECSYICHDCCPK